MNYYPPFQIFSLLKHVPERLFNSVSEVDRYRAGKANADPQKKEFVSAKTAH